MKEIEALKRNLKKKSSEKEQKLLKMQKNVEQRLRKLVQENNKIKNQLEAERFKNQGLLNLQKNMATQMTNYTINENELDDTSCKYETTFENTLSGYKLCSDSSMAEDGNNTYHNLKDGQLMPNHDISNVTYSGIEEVSFDFLDCSINSKDALTSTRMSINKKRRESRRQTIFGLLQENSAYKKQLQMECKRSLNKNQELLFLEDKIDNISLDRDAGEQQLIFTVLQGYIEKWSYL